MVEAQATAAVTQVIETGNKDPDHKVEKHDEPERSKSTHVERKEDFVPSEGLTTAGEWAQYAYSGRSRRCVGDPRALSTSTRHGLRSATAACVDARLRDQF